MSLSLTSSHFDRIDVDMLHDGIAVVRMDGGPLGMLDRPLVDDLSALVDIADADTAVRAVVLTGTRPDRFAGHADIRWLREGADHSPSLTRFEATVLMRFIGAAAKSSTFRKAAKRTPLAGVVELDRFHDTFVRMNSSRVVYIAAVNGSALGGGAELAWACDVRIMADDNAFLGQMEVLLGFNPGGGGTQRLARLVDSHRALLAILDGGPIGPEEALRIGAVDALAAPADLIELSITYARRLSSRSAPAIAAIKRAVYFGATSPLRDGLTAERAEFLRSLGTEQARAAMNSYIRAYESAGDLLMYNRSHYDRAIRDGHWAPPAGDPSSDM